MKYVFCFCFALCCTTLRAQDTATHHLKGVFFPYPMDRSWKVSLGFTNTTMPYDITEEIHYRIPAFDVHILKKLSPSFYTDIRGSVQVLQNLFTIGPRWVHKFSERYSMALGNDFGVWFGNVNVQEIKTRGHGFENIPNFSLGRRFNKKVLLTFRADALMDFGIKTYAVDTELKTKRRLLSGSSYSIVLEQPFYGKKAITLGFRAIYSDFFWQTWTLFESFDRNIFYPQIIVGLNL
jgi:hypothetical protein